jgi:hypothetical protein
MRREGPGLIPSPVLSFSRICHSAPLPAFGHVYSGATLPGQLQFIWIPPLPWGLHLLICGPAPPRTWDPIPVPFADFLMAIRCPPSSTSNLRIT